VKAFVVVLVPTEDAKGVLPGDNGVVATADASLNGPDLEGD